MSVPDSEDALLADCSAARMKTIAKAMHLTGFARLLKADLEALISTAMLQITECPTCGGGQCQPTEHYFAPVQQMYSSATSSPDHNALANLGNVIMAVGQKNTHVPYRNSRLMRRKLTHLLQNCLGDNSNQGGVLQQDTQLFCKLTLK